jgi:hypothetical protein
MRKGRQLSGAGDHRQAGAGARYRAGRAAEGAGKASAKAAADDRVCRFPGPAPVLIGASHRPTALGQASPSANPRAQVSGVAKRDFWKITGAGVTS